MSESLQNLRSLISRKQVSAAPLYEQAMEEVLGSHFMLANRPHHEGSEMSLATYVRSRPTTKGQIRQFFHIQRLGLLTDVEEELVGRMVAYVESMFGIVVQQVEDLSEAVLPHSIRRQAGKTPVLEADFILSNLIAQFVPRSSMGLIVMTPYLLESESLGSELMGCALPGHRAALWTLRPFRPRLRDSSQRERVTEQFLKLAAHEMGHILGLPHCETYTCIMGIVEDAYLDLYPAAFCPTCLAKLCWNLGMDEYEWLIRQHSYWTQHQHSFHTAFYARLIQLYERSLRT